MKGAAGEGIGIHRGGGRGTVSEGGGAGVTWYVQISFVVQGGASGRTVGWVDSELGSSVGRYCSYLLPKQDGGTSQI